MKKALIFALSFALACTLAACGDTDSQTESTSTDPADTSTTESTPEPADTAPSQLEGDVSGGESSLAGAEKVWTFEGANGEIYGTLTLSGWLNSGRSEFDFGGEETLDWSYADVAIGSTCTIEPSELVAYTALYLSAYTQQDDGVYFPSSDDTAPWHRIYADGRVEPSWYDESECQTATYGHPAYFTFGSNDGTASVAATEDNEPYAFILKADGTMYELRIELYDTQGNKLAGYTQPFFVQGDNGETPQSEGNTIEIENIRFTCPDGMKFTSVDGHSMAEIVSGNDRLEIVVSSQEYMNGGYESVVERGTRETNANGDTYYYQANSFQWLFATDDGAFISMTGDGDWQSIAGAVEWSVIE